VFFEKVKPVPFIVLDEHTAAHVAELFRSFSDTSRVRILSAIVDQEMNTSTLAKLVEVTESAVSHHMRGLRQMRLVQARRSGKEVYYSLTDPHVIALFRQGVEHIKQDE
jgi:ArsR family transcriptional regulator, lead/cadmium/zinc/bismuth-responsive transcriptional repressor